jgi:hypothetical protein
MGKEEGEELISRFLTSAGMTVSSAEVLAERTWGEIFRLQFSDLRSQLVGDGFVFEISSCSGMTGVDVIFDVGANV